MKLDMTAPCDNCPFRTDAEGFHRTLGYERVEEILDSMITLQQTFQCHKTLQYDEEGDFIEGPNAQHCAGALILLEKEERPNQMMRWMERIGQYDRTKLDMGAPVFDSVDEMLDAYEEGDRSHAFNLLDMLDASIQGEK